MPFNKWKKRIINKVERRQNRVLGRFISDMEKVMEDAVDYVVANFEQTGRFAAPTLNSMFRVSEEFYRSVIREASLTAEEAIAPQKSGKKKLASGRGGLPRNKKWLQSVFRNSKYWSSVMNRSDRLTKKLQNQYIEKLQSAFEEVLPRIRQGEITTKEVKTHMMEAWGASKSRVETIFRTETTNYFARTQVAYFSGEPEIIGFLFDALKDSATTKICRDRHGLVYRPGTELLKESTPSCHYNCRSHLIALANTPENRKLLADPRRDPKNRTVEPLPRGWSK